MLRLLLSVSALLVVTVSAQKPPICTAALCKPPSCYCRSSELPFNPDTTSIKGLADVPQFVMLTFDDAVSDSNILFYQELLLNSSRKNPGKGCKIRATFFATHEYTNYAYLNQLYLAGHEIASHSITHTSLTDKWRSMNESTWKAEMFGFKELATKYGLIPGSAIKGTRAPFLQTSGNSFFQMLSKKENGFLYDSSFPTRTFTRPPMWPYTLNHGYDQDCIIHPCPDKTYAGIWEVPLVMLFKMRIVSSDGHKEEYPCAMADACIPLPDTAKETVEYLYENFKRHYLTNRAPFPLFIHEAWLKHPGRKQGYLEFVDYLLNNPTYNKDVFMVTVQDVIAYMMNPKPLSTYATQACPSVVGGTGCQKRACNYKVGLNDWETRRIDTCVACPEGYPWVHNIDGRGTSKPTFD